MYYMYNFSCYWYLPTSLYYHHFDVLQDYFIISAMMFELLRGKEPIQTE